MPSLKLTDMKNFLIICLALISLLTTYGYLKEKVIRRYEHKQLQAIADTLYERTLRLDIQYAYFQEISDNVTTYDSLYQTNPQAIIDRCFGGYNYGGN